MSFSSQEKLFFCFWAHDFFMADTTKICRLKKQHSDKYEEIRRHQLPSPEALPIHPIVAS
jgi:hypothetical protein